MDHCLTVYGALRNHAKIIAHLLKSSNNKDVDKEWEPREDSMILTALLHDICKAGEYSKDLANKKVGGQWVQVPYYATAPDTLPIGHGEKSVILAMRHIDLTDEEVVAIRQHMGVHDLPKYGSCNSAATVGEAYSGYPLALALSHADQTASYLLEERGVR